MVEFRLYVTPNGASPFREWLDGLDQREQAKVYATIRNIEQHGMPVALRNEWVKKLDADIWEIRAQFAGNAQRAPFFLQDDIGIITHGFSKKTRKVPRQELLRARRIMTRYKEEQHAIATV